MHSDCASDAFDQAEWEEEQRRLAVMFSSMYTVGEDEDDDKDGEQQAVEQTQEVEPILMPSIYDSSSEDFVSLWQQQAMRKSMQPIFLRRALQHAAKFPEPVILAELMSDTDIAAVVEFAKSIAVPEQGWARYGELSSLSAPTHSAIYLHYGGRMGDGEWRRIEDVCPAILERLTAEVRRAASEAGLCDAALELNRRCVEYHEYKLGGGLADPGHCDQGSTLTLSVALSHPPELGGRFSTARWAGGTADGGISGGQQQTTEHELARGDGIVFCSEIVHNVTAVAGPSDATRESLVVEWWTGPHNTRDRDS